MPQAAEGPWTKFAAPPPVEGPWTRYQQPTAPTAAPPGSAGPSSTPRAESEGVRGPWERFAAPSHTPTAGANWWDEAPRADAGAQPSTNWWEAAPVVSNPEPAPQARTADTVQAEYDALPWYGKAAQAADDVVRLVANGATFGYADRLAGAANGTGAEVERLRTREASDRAGSAALPAELLGAVATPVLAARAGVSLPALAAETTGATGVAARSALAGVEGAGYGALDASGHDRSVLGGSVLGALFGAGGNAAGEAVLTGAGKIASLFGPGAPKLPTRDEVADTARAAYDRAESLGVFYTPQATDRLQTAVVGKLADMGYDPALQPGAAAVVRRLGDVQGENVTLKGLDTLRKVANNGFIPGNRSNNAAVAKIVGEIDDIIATPAAGDVLSGNAGAAADAMHEARDYWGRAAKADAVGRAVERGELNAAASGSGANTENATRQALKSLANNESAMRSFTPDERAALATAIRGTSDQNALRLLGKLAPTGIVSGGLGSGMGAYLGGMVGGPVGAAVGAVGVPAVGTLARKASNGMEAASVDELVKIILAGGTKSATRAHPTAAERAIDANRDDLLRTLFGASVASGAPMAAPSTGRGR